MRNFSILCLCAGLFTGCGVSSGVSEDPQGNLPQDIVDELGMPKTPSDGSGPGADGLGATGTGAGDNGDGDGDGDGDGQGMNGDGDGDVGSASLPPCGDGTDECDETDLGGETCESLGETGGELRCDPVTCMFDTSMCTGSSSGSGGSGGAAMGFFGGGQGNGGQGNGGRMPGGFGGGN